MPKNKIALNFFWYKLKFLTNKKKLIIKLIITELRRISLKYNFKTDLKKISYVAMASITIFFIFVLFSTIIILPIYLISKYWVKIYSIFTLILFLILIIVFFVFRLKKMWNKYKDIKFFLIDLFVLKFIPLIIIIFLIFFETIIFRLFFYIFNTSVILPSIIVIIINIGIIVALIFSRRFFFNIKAFLKNNEVK